MKKILYILTIVLTGCFSACTDILDTAPYNQLGSSSMWKSESLCDQGVRGIYYFLRFPLRSSDIVGEALYGGTSPTNPPGIGYYAWEVFGSTGQSRLSVSNIFTQGVTPSNTHFSHVWKWCYDGIHAANDAIANLPEAPVSAEKKAALIAESKILRAYFYMRLNELFGNGGIGVPIYTEPIASDECIKSQSSETEVWSLIIQDLTDAVGTASLPDNTIGKEGRVSKGAAYALRGRAHLLSKEYAKSADDFSKVANCGYGLFNDYKTMFKVANEGNKEMIFYIQNIEDPSGFGSRLQKYCAPWNCGSQDARTCWTDIQVSPYVVDLYEFKTDGNTAKSFNWEDVIPGWNNLSVTDRMVYFIRDKEINGKEIHATITSQINTQLNKLSAVARALYLPEGNEARIKAAYANRDPRMNYSIIVPYSEMIGVSSTSTSVDTYISRWPATNNAKYNFDQDGSESKMAKDGKLPVSEMKTTLSPNGQAYFYYMFRKFVGEGTEYKLRQDNPCDEPIIRYADVLLMWAEALVEQSNVDLAGAKEKVKQVRDRVNMPTMDKDFANQATARNYIRDERRRELVCEGVNFFDEMRWKTLKDTKFEYGAKTSMQVWGGVATGQPVYGWNDFWYTWPVPKGEIELNRNLTRTPGWNYN